MLSFRELSIRVGALVRGRPRESQEFRELAADACRWTANRQETLKRQFGIGRYERYDWFQERGLIIFSSGGKPEVVAEIQFVGTTSNRTKTWLWAWANDSLLASLTEHSRHVRHVGESRGYGKLTTAKWYADETDAWEMSSIQAMLTEARGVYRSQQASGSTFLTLRNVRMAEPGEWYEAAPDAPEDDRVE